MNVGKKKTKKMQNRLYCNFFCLCTPRYRVTLWTVTWICLVTALELATTCRLLLRALLFIYLFIYLLQIHSTTLQANNEMK